MPSIVALDIETTGLDPRTDRMIEIGAIRFNGNRIEDEFSTLINPNIQIPSFIQQLTGITNAMIQNSPQLEDILPELKDFVGGSPILGHNVSFDMAFLNEAGVFQYNQSIDTYALASALMPGANRYGLGSLGQQL